MKRSEYIALGAIGLLVVATMWPRSGPPPIELPGPVAPDEPGVAQGDGFQTLAFASLDECRNAQVVTQATCDIQFREAEGASVADAPKFEALSACEAEYGANACRPAMWQGASVFVPALAGVLIARSLLNNQASSQPLYPPRVGPAACPPGSSPPQQPECQPRTASSSSTGGGGGGRSYYSTGSGRTIGRVAGSVIADVILPNLRPTTLRGGGGWSTGAARTSVATVSRAASRPSSSFSTTSSSRGGFGSIGSSRSSSSS